jgi:hypothetical protein
VAHTAVQFPEKATGIFIIFHEGKEDGTFEEIHENLHDRCRKRQKRHRLLRVGVVGSKEVNSARVGSENQSKDGEKNVRKVKKHTVKDGGGLLLAGEIHAANENEGKAGFREIKLLSSRLERVKKITPTGVTGAGWKKCQQ